jgi:hypothetical protein
MTGQQTIGYPFLIQEKIVGMSISCGIQTPHILSESLPLGALHHQRAKIESREVDRI